MLDLSSLGQLKQLKQDIHASTPRIKGVVKGTSKRFGFLVSDEDGQEYLLPQSEMERVLPGDSVQVVLEEGKTNDKPIAKVEKFFSSSLPAFIGSVKIKNDQYYVIPDHPQLNRWLFVPPKYRKNLKEGDLVSAQICQHPFKNKGRVQAEVLAMIGQPGDPFIEHRYAIVKQGIDDKVWQQDELNAIRQTAEQTLEHLAAQAIDKRDIHFITIDGQNTQDLDDALFVEKNSEGWLLQVAIADASAFIDANSALDKLAAKQASSIYLPGQKVPMLPDVLSSDICSLRPNVDRLAFICRIQINTKGEIITTQYEQAVIQSKAKLSYDAVANFLNGAESALEDDCKAVLAELNKLALQRQLWRQEHALIMDEYADYRYQLNEKGKITAITRQDRNIAQKLVEECMLCCNQATAGYLSEHTSSALYLSHNGFKKDQMPGVKKLLIALNIEIDPESLAEVDQYLNLHKTLQKHDSDLPLREILRKKLNRSEWSKDKAAHYGLGFQGYTTFTSPIRKYSDLLCHRMIKAIAAGETYELSSEDVNALNHANQLVRDAQRDCELALKCQYIKPFKGQQYSGEISMVNHRMVGVYLKEFDVHAQIEVRNIEGSYTFKQDSLQLIGDERSFQLKQLVDVVVDNVDIAQRQIRLKLV